MVVQLRRVCAFRVADVLVKNFLRRAKEARVDSGQAADIGSLRAFLALRHLELHALVFSQRLETTALDFLEVSEEIFATIGRGDEAKAFAFVEPFTVPV